MNSVNKSNGKQRFSLQCEMKDVCRRRQLKYSYSKMKFELFFIIIFTFHAASADFNTTAM